MALIGNYFGDGEALAAVLSLGDGVVAGAWDRPVVGDSFLHEDSVVGFSAGAERILLP